VRLGVDIATAGDVSARLVFAVERLPLGAPNELDAILEVRQKNRLLIIQNRGP
jgi:hypothetical protein